MPPTGVPQDRKAPRKTKAKTQPVQPVVPGEDPYSPKQWGSSAGPGVEDLTCPSGQRALVRRPGVAGLIAAGVLHDIDTLSQIVDEKHVKRVAGQPVVDKDTLAADPDALANVMHVVDRVTAYVVLRPPVKMAPNDPTSREDGVIYTDMVDLEDRMFIFNFAVGGTRDLEKFRRESGVALGNVDDEQGSVVQAEPAAQSAG